MQKLELLETRAKGRGSVVLCHSDLLAGNIIKLPDGVYGRTPDFAAREFVGCLVCVVLHLVLGRWVNFVDKTALRVSAGAVRFIDFEYAAAMERGYDVANHFLEYAGKAKSGKRAVAEESRS